MKHHTPDNLHFRIVEITAPVLVETVRRQVLAQHPEETADFGTTDNPNPDFQVFQVLLYGTKGNQLIQVWDQYTTYITASSTDEPGTPEEHVGITVKLNEYAASQAMIPWADAPAFLRHEHQDTEGQLRLTTKQALPL